MKAKKVCFVRLVAFIRFIKLLLGQLKRAKAQICKTCREFFSQYYLPCILEILVKENTNKVSGVRNGWRKRQFNKAQ